MNIGGKSVEKIDARFDIQGVARESWQIVIPKNPIL